MLEFAALGPLEVRRDGQVVPLGPPKQRAVLGVLLLQAGRVVSTDRIISDVWGEDVPGSVSSSLQAYVSNLRRLLRDDESATSPLVRQAPGYRCDVTAEQTDLGRFATGSDRADRALTDRRWAEAAAESEAALGLWRGPLLADLADEEWVRVVAVATEQRRSACRQTLITAQLGLGRINAAVSGSADLLHDHPLDERACWLRLIALYRAGRTADALETLRHYTERLDDELGLEPGPALRDLQHGMLRQDPQLSHWPEPECDAAVPGVIEPDRTDPEPRVPATGTKTSTATGTAHTRPVENRAADPFVGRHRELAAAAEVLAPGRSGWVVLEGEAGMGKSRLAQACVDRWAELGGAVVRTGCPDDDSLPAWWPLRQVLRELGADADALLLPGADEVDLAGFATYERVRSVLVEAAGRAPLLILVDDAHWADQTSLGFLTLLAESTPVPGLAVVLTTRPPAAGGRATALVRLLAAAARARRGRHLSVSPLSLAEVAEVAAQVSGGAVGESEAAPLAARTGGNPFFVTEYARLPDDVRRSGGVPGAVRSVLERRLSAVDSEVLQVLRTAAVIGQRLDLDLLQRVTRLDRDDLADLLDDAADEHLIVAGPSGGYEFVHALMREQIADGLAGLRRQRLHVRIAEQVATRTGSDALVQRASHLVAALPLGEADQVVAACCAAAEDADARWQSDDAAYWWGCALQAHDLLPTGAEHERDDLVLAQVLAYARAGRGQTVLDTVDEALDSAMRTGRLAGAGRIAGSLLRSSGAWPWAIYGAESQRPLLQRLQTLAELVADDLPSHIRVLATLAVGSCYDPDSTVPDGLSASALALAEKSGDPELIADALLGRALTFSGIADRAVESAGLLDRLAQLEHSQQRLDQVFCNNLGSMALLMVGRIEETERAVREGISGCELLRLPVSRAQLRWIEAQLSQWHGEDLQQAYEQYRRAWEIHRSTELYQQGVFELSNFVLAWEHGRLADFELGEANAALFWVRLLTDAVRKAPGSAAALTREAARDEAVIWTTHGRLTLLAHVAVDLGRTDLAEPIRARLTPYTGMVGNIGQVANAGPVDLALARLALLAGDLDAARSHLSTATELAGRGPARRHLVRCRLLAIELGVSDVAEIGAIRAEAARLGVPSVAVG